MGTMVKPGASDFIKIDPCPQGTHQAVCYGIWDIVLQKITWQGNEKIMPKIVVAWEINKLIDCPGNDFDGLNYVLSKTYTNSTHEKSNLIQDLAALGITLTPIEQAEGFDIEGKLMGLSCLIGVVHKKGTNGTVYANIGSLVPLPDGFKEMPASLPNDPPKWVLKKREEQVVPGQQTEEPPDVGSPPPQDEFTQGVL